MTKTSRLAVLRTDASAERSIGHAMRCRALADAFSSRGYRCRFAGTAETFRLAPGLDTDPIVLERPNDPRQLAGLMAEDCDVLVIDHYDLGYDYESALRPYADAILAIDDLADRRHDADILVDPTVGRHESDYRLLVANDCRMALGPDYALLRRVFQDRRDSAIRARTARQGIKRIVVSLGGLDHLNVTAIVISALHDAGAFESVDVVLAASAPHLETVRAAIKPGMTLHVGLGDEIADLFADADLAIGAPGGTSWERCCVGLPTLLVTTADNQRLIARNLVTAGAAVELGDATDLDPGQVTSAIRDLIRSPERLADMSTAAARICDGRGASRLAEMTDFLLQGINHDA